MGGSFCTEAQRTRQGDSILGILDKKSFFPDLKDKKKRFYRTMADGMDFL